MGLFIHKGLSGTSEFIESDNIWRGNVIGISEIFSYEAASEQLLYEEFEKTVDEYREGDWWK